MDRVDEADPAARWRVFGERSLYDNPWVRLQQVDVQAPDGTRFWHHVVRLPRIAMAIVLDGHGRVLMLWRHRFVPDTFGWELPGGFAEEGEKPAAAAAREAEEETGWRPVGPATHLMTFQPVPGMVDTPSGIFLFHGAEYVGEPTATEEAGRVAWLSRDELRGLIERGSVVGAGWLVGLLYLLARDRPTATSAGW